MGKLVSLVKGAERKQNIKNALEYVMPDLRAAFEGKRRILIKPNLTDLQAGIANTHVNTIDAVIEFLEENFADFKKMQITVAEGSGTAFYHKQSTMRAFENCNFNALAEKYENVKLDCVENWRDFGYIEVPIKAASGTSRLRVPKEAFDFDFRISVAIPKTHDAAIATFGIKNMMGLIAQEDKALMHAVKSGIEPSAKRGILDYTPTKLIVLAKRVIPKFIIRAVFHNTYANSVRLINCNIAEFSKALWPDLVILDAFECMEGNGPIDGNPVEMKLAIASCDPLKADALGARLMGLNPEEIGYLHYLRDRGDISTEGLVGNAKLQECARNFKMHETYEIQKRWRG